MKRTLKLFLVAAGFIAGMIYPSCSGGKQSEAVFGETAFQASGQDPAATDNKPLTMKLVVNDTYCMETACKCIHHLASRRYDELQSRLRTAYNIDLQLTYCMDEADLQDSIRSMHFDGAICKPWFALMYMPGYGMKYRRITDVLDPFENGLLGGVFIVKKDSPVKEPADINGKTIALGQADSYEKYHLPMHMMQKEGITPGYVINKPICTEGINALLDGTADVAVISDYAFIASCAADFADEDAFRIIWKTGDIPLCSVMLDLDRISEKDALKLQQALLAITDEGIPEEFASSGFVKPLLWTPDPISENTHKNGKEN